MEHPIQLNLDFIGSLRISVAVTLSKIVAFEGSLTTTVHLLQSKFDEGLT